jgi:acyl transferase domain-containing protein/NADPH:quinone reductase-like Zn-dependent oxidoreductase/acyl carrier protein
VEREVTVFSQAGPCDKSDGDVPPSTQVPIAIIGMACRFPGAADVNAFWELLRRGGDALRDVPPNRYLDLEDLLDPRTGKPCKIATLQGGFLDDIDLFDPYPFNISPREAAFIDPQQRLLLETAWEALEDAGLDLRRLAGSNTGVYTGQWLNDYHARVSQATRDWNIHTILGTAMFAASGRLSFVFDFQGPSISVDTACSSALVAVHLACKGLATGECGLALAGGTNLILRSDATIGFSASRALSPEGRCKFGDALANGFVRSEGAGVIVLKTLAQALADGDPIHAVIRGSAVNNGGQLSGSLMAPAEEGQYRLMRQAYACAGTSAADLDYVEAHGTGTRVGDPMELRALGRILTEERGPAAASAPPCLVGSVKGNIGHTEGASGVAGLIKAVLCLKHREVPPTLQFHQPSPKVPWDSLPLRMATAATPIPIVASRDRAVVAVNSFGLAGTFAHVILEEAPRPAGASILVGTPRASAAVHLLPIAARSDRALNKLADGYADLLQTTDCRSDDLCYSASLRRTHHEARVAVVGRSPKEMADGLRAFTHGEPMRQVFSGRHDPSCPPKVAFVFSGQGPQWARMGLKLFTTEPVFCDVLQRLDTLIQAKVGWSLLHELGAGPDSRLNQTAIAQPAIFAIQVGLAALLESWGIHPAAVVGHSVGEAAAAYIAGALTFEDAVHTICHRGRIMQDAIGLGKMAAVELTEAEARELLTPYGERLALAAINGPRSLTLSGAAAALQEVCAKVEARGRFCRVLDVEYAFHSNQMDRFLGDMEAALVSVAARRRTLPLYSTVHGDLAGEGDFGPTYWLRNIRDTVRFAAAIRKMAEAGCNLFLEISPHPVLAHSVKQCLEDLPERPPVFTTLQREGDEALLMRCALGALYAHGCDPDWASLFPQGGRYVSLPTYPWQRERFWVEEKKAASTATANRRRRRDGTPACPLLPQYLRPAGQPDNHFWEASISLQSFPWLTDHRVEERPIFPAAGYLLMALAAAEEVRGVAAIGATEFSEAMFLSEDGNQTLQLGLQGDKWEINSCSTTTASSPWRKHVAGVVAPGPLAAAPAAFALEAFCSGNRQTVSASAHYQAMKVGRLDYGPCFRGVDGTWAGDGEAVARLTLPEAVATEAPWYGTHPATLDACFQALLVLVRSGPDDHSLWLPQGIESARLWHHPDADDTLWGRVVARPRPDTAGPQFIGDVFLLNSRGQVLVEVRGLRLRRVDRLREDISDWMYEVEWHSRPLPVCVDERRADFVPTPKELEVLLEARPAGAEPEQELVRAVMHDLDHISALFTVAALHQLGLSFVPGRCFRTEELARELGIVDQHRRLLNRLLGILTEDGHLSREGDIWRIVRAPKEELPLPAWEAAALRHPEFAEALHLFRRCSTNLAEVLAGRGDALELLFGSGAMEHLQRLYTRSPFLRAANELVGRAVQEAVRRLPQGRTLRVLEIGGGTGGTTAFILPMLPAGRSRFVFTDLSTFFLSKARERFADYPFVEYGALDIEKDPVGQGLAAQGFDIVVAANCLHATRNLRQTLANARRLLAPGGCLVLNELTRPRRWLDLIFGLTEGWWLFEDTDLRPEHALLSPAAWRQVLTETGFESAVTVPEKGQQFEDARVVLARRPDEQGETAAAPLAATPGRWLILADRCGGDGRLADALQRGGEACVVVGPGDGPSSREEHTRLLHDFIAAGDAPPRGIIDLRPLDRDLPPFASAADLQEVERQAIGTTLGLAQALIDLEVSERPRWVLVTRGSQATAADAADLSLVQATVWSMAEVAALEHPELRLLRVDIDPTEGLNIDSLLPELFRNDGEDEVALRGGDRLAPRLVPHRPGVGKRLVLPEGGPFQLVIGKVGSLDGIEPRPVTLRPPGPQEVQVRARATGLNFRDLLCTLGAAGAGPLGLECSGVVTALGEGVTGLAVGDEVMATCLGGLSTHVTTHSALVLPKPPTLSHEEAATLPIAYLTAYAGLYDVAKMRRGDRVLIHSAAGGVGVAAIHLAHAAGAEVFGTAGSNRKRGFLRALGVQHVFDSRSLDFAEHIHAVTGGRGVDIALNSFSDEFIPKTFSVLAEGGRFIELGKRGVWSNEQAARYRPDVLYTVIDLYQTMLHEPESLRPMFRRLYEDICSGALPPLPVQAFPMAETVQAFRFMQQARHIGKIAITQPRWGVGNSVDGPKAFHDGTWLITGGFSGLGLNLAQWLEDRGARALVLVGRRLPEGTARAAVDALRQRGVNVLATTCDVSREEEVRRLLDQVRTTQGPLRGVFHLAGALDDGALVAQTWERFATVYRPKVLGAWNLHQLTRGDQLDCFVLYSSWTSLLGSAGQANHSSANAFMDALAWRRRAVGLPGLSINWGAWGEIGSAIQGDRAAYLARKGVGTFTPAQGQEALGGLLSEGTRQAGFSPFDVTAWRASSQTAAASKFTELLGSAAKAEEVAPEQPTEAGPLREALLAAKAGPTRRRVMEGRVQKHLARVLRLPAARFDASKPFKAMGLDSLTAVELRNHLEDDTGLKLPATLVWNFSTISALAGELAGKMGVLLDSESATNGHGTNGKQEGAALPLTADDELELRRALEDLEQLSEEEVRRLLAGETSGEHT